MLLYLALTFTLGALVGCSSLVVLPLLKPHRSIGRKYLWLAMLCVKRGTLMLQEDGELNFKKIKYDPIGAEKVSIGGDTVTVTDSARALSTFAGKPFALSDEVHGVLFRVTDVIVGKRERILESQGSIIAEATRQERQEHGVAAWLRKWIRVPTNKPVDLRDVRQLATGKERGTDPSLMKEWYKFSRIRDGTGMAFIKHLIPIAAFIVTLIAIWQISIRTGGSAETAAPVNETARNTTLSVLALAIPFRNSWRKVLAFTIGAGISVVLYSIFGWIYLTFMIVFIVGIAIGAIGTFALVALFGVLGIGAWLSGFLLDMALQCYENPTFVETESDYVLREGSGEGPSHKLGKHRVYFEATPGAVRARDDYAGTAERVARPQPDRTTKGSVANCGYYLPAIEAKEGDLYVWSVGALGALASGFIGNASDKRVQEAKREYGGGNLGASDTMLLYATLGALALAAIVGVFVFL